EIGLPVEFRKALRRARVPEATDRYGDAQQEQDRAEAEGKVRRTHARSDPHRIARDEDGVADLHAIRDHREQQAENGEIHAAPKILRMSYLHLDPLFGIDRKGAPIMALLAWSHRLRVRAL